jgi:uncharacterized protein (TIGR02118 family)
MIKVSVLYPSGDDVTFDHQYYLDSHIPMVADLLGDKLKDVTVDRGLGGGAPDAAPPYVAMAHLVFDSVEDFQAAMGPHSEKIGGDVPNYTNTTAVLQISEIAK